MFLQAEAAQRGWISGTAQQYYEEAIKQSFKYMEVPAGDFSAYNQQAGVSFAAAAANAKIERIIEQKWLALNSISSIEAWNDYRRLGLPNIPNSLDAPSPTARPLRLMYPETERMTNNEEASKQGNDDITTAKIWWMK
ncbi:Starch-binding associating with outer membrane [compost metagenome]